MEKLVLEISLPKTNIKQIVKVDTFPLTIGRGYNNDVILSDEYISQNHLKLDLIDDKLTIIDCESENGIFIKKTRLENSTVIELEQEIRVGKSKIRILPANHILLPAKKLDINKSFLEKYKIVLIAWTSLILLLLLQLLDTFNHTNEKVELIKLMGGFPQTIGMCLAITGLFTLIGKLVKKEICFHKQLLFATFLAGHADTIKMALTNYILFNFSAPMLETFVEYFFYIPLYVIILVKMFQYSTNVSFKNLVIVLSSFFYIITALMSFDDYTKASGFSSKLNYTSKLRPKYYKIKSSKTLDEYSKESLELFEKTDISD